LIKKPAVLLLDEATSALDAQSEKLVQQSIDALSKEKGQTTIIIAHRLSAVRGAHRIIVMERGQIVETGSHQELLAHESSHYAHLHRLQQG
jgi:subfamily B ATP-binding cassette protein HlyB/CyaB